MASVLETHFNCIIFFQISALSYPSQHSSDRFDMYCQHCHEDRFEFIEQFQKGICSAFISRPIWACTYSVVFDKGTFFCCCNCSDAFLCTWNQYSTTAALKSSESNTYNFLKVKMDCFFYCESNGNRSKR